MGQAITLLLVGGFFLFSPAWFLEKCRKWYMQFAPPPTSIFYRWSIWYSLANPYTFHAIVALRFVGFIPFIIGLYVFWTEVFPYVPALQFFIW